MLDGVAYASLMQLSKALGKEITWNQQDRTFYIGLQPGGVDMIDDFVPYHWSGLIGYYPTRKNKTVKIVNKEYNQFIHTEYKGEAVYYNLEGKFSNVTFLAYSKNGTTFKLYGDNNALLYEAKIWCFGFAYLIIVWTLGAFLNLLLIMIHTGIYI